jgi:hypothetical protein
VGEFAKKKTGGPMNPGRRTAEGGCPPIIQATQWLSVIHVVLDILLILYILILQEQEVRG